jgi:methyl-accepting chemotaxis protein
MATANNRSVARRVTTLAIALVALVLVLVGLAISVLTERSTRAQVVGSVGDTARSVAQSLDAADATNRELVHLNMTGFQRYFEATMQLDEGTGELRSYGGLVNEDYSPVDKFTKETGGIATVFARKGNDFVRITTSAKNAQGQRNMGTLLEAGPALEKARTGEPYTGRTVVEGKPYMGYYLPSKDAGGKVIALLFIGNDISVFEGMLEKQVAQTKFFENGGAYVIDPRSGLDEAVFVAHPTARGKKVLQTYPQSRAFFEALSASPDGFVREAADVLGGAAKDPWALVRKTQADGWWVVAEVPDGEAMASQFQVMLAVWGMMAVAVVLLAAGLFVMLRRGVSQPLRQLTQAVTLVAQGDLTQAFHTTQRDEIGALVQEVDAMRLRYLEMLQEVRTAVDNINTASAEIASGNQDLSARTEQTASSLQTTAQSMEELTATVRQSADAARQANQLAGSAAEVAARGGQVVGEVVTTMGEINQSSRKHFRHHRRDRQHCLPDQHPRAQRRRGSRSRGRAGPGLCRGGQRGARPGRPRSQRGARNQGSSSAHRSRRSNRARAWCKTPEPPWTRSWARCSAWATSLARSRQPLPSSPRASARSTRRSTSSTR